MNADVLRVQRELIKRGYLAAGQDDGVFGLITLDAVNHYRATLGKPPLGPSIKRIDIAELLLTLFPAEYAPVHYPPLPSTNPLRLLWALLPVFTKGTAMTSDQITGIVRLLMGMLSGYFLSRGIGTADIWAWVTAGVLGVVPAVWSWWNNRPKVIAPIGK